MKALKAKTKAQKRRGRKRLPPVDREPSGRPSRRKASVDDREKQNGRAVKAVAQNARIRIYGLPEADSDRPEAGYVLGRLYLAGDLGPRVRGETAGCSENRLEAGNRMAQDFARYYGLVGIPFPSARALDMFSVRGEPGPSNPEAARHAANAVMGIEGALGMADQSGRPVTSVTKRVCVQDEANGLAFGHMLEFLRRGLDALVVYYKIGA